MVERQLFSLRDDIQDKAKPQKWGHQIQRAPECIILMARCKLLMSRESLMTLEIHVQSLESTSLRANIRQCTQMGQDALRSTAEQMGEVDRLAQRMSEKEGIIDSILQYMGNKGQSPMRHRRLQHLISKGLDNVEKSVNVISGVKQNFGQWKEVTKSLLLALEQKTTDNMRKKKEIEKVLAERQSRRDMVREAINAQEESAQNLTTALENFRRGYNDFRENNPESDPLMGGVVAFFKAPSVLYAAFAAGLPGRMDYLQRNNKILDDRVNELQNEIESTIGVREILGKTLTDLSKLQEQVEHFMEFLISIQRVMDDIKDSHGQVLMRDLTADDLNEFDKDHELKRDYDKDADLLKNRFLIVYKAASLYNEVSGEFILPGVTWLTGLCFVDGSEAAFKEGELEIEAKCEELCVGAKRLVTRRINEIEIELKLLHPESSGNQKKAHVEDVTNADGETA